ESDIPAGPGAPSVAVVAYGFATAHFGSADAAIGKLIGAYANPLQIVGVAAPGFRYPDGADIWVAWGTENGADREEHNYRAVGRLKRDVALAHAQAQVRTIAAAL